MDAYGHVNNVQFLRLLEDARVVAFAAAGTDEGGSVVNRGLIVARAEIEYLTPLVYRTAPVAIDLWVIAIGGADFEMAYEILDGPSGDEATPAVSRGEGGPGPAVYARAATTMVVYDLDRQRPRRLTPTERNRLEAWRDRPQRWRHRRPG
jgi:acyl-CoA thioester hydrolase